MPITRKFKFGAGRRDGRADLDNIDVALQNLDIKQTPELNEECTELSRSVLGKFQFDRI